MNSNPHNSMDSANTNSGEETLRLIANLPSPEGLEERVHKSLRAAPRAGRVLAWPAGMRSRVSLTSNAFRTAAAAAIVFVVVGGGWGVYSRVQQVQNGRVVVMPARMTNTGGFSGAGAIRTPETLPGPKIGDQGKEQESAPAKKPLEIQKGLRTTSGTSRSAGKQHIAGQHSATEPALQPAIAR
jgi:hypothetical protein